MKKIKHMSMFSGYGGAEFALKNAGIDFETVGYSEIDKYAIQCYEQNYYNSKGERIKEEFTRFGKKFSSSERKYVDGCGDVKIRNYGDCTKIIPEELPDFDLLTGGFPCPTFSVAGKGAGTEDPRGKLFWDILRVAKVKKPKYMLLENVKGLTGKRHIDTFEEMLFELDEAGYNVNWKVLNSKEHGIPQNRERVWFVCIRKDIKQDFEFPEKEELKIFLKDILEDEVDEKYYLKPEQVERFSEYSKKKVLANMRDVNGCSSTITANPQRATIDNGNLVKVGMIKQTYVKRSNDTPKNINQFLKDNKGQLTLKEISEKVNLPKTQIEHYFRTDKSRAVPSPENWKKLKEILKFNNSFDKLVTETYEKEVTFESTRRVYSDKGCNPCISSTNAAKLVQINNPKHFEPKTDGTTNSITTVQKDNYILQRGRGNNKGGIKAKDGVIPALSSSSWQENNHLISGTRIRKLTPKECFRLMGFLNDEINLEGISNSQRYKLAGNGWEINIVRKLLKNLIK